MKVKIDRVFFAVKYTPDYMEVLGFATSHAEAESLIQDESYIYNPEVVEVDLAQLLELLLELLKDKES